jgi:hypothetical protein
MIYLSTGVVKTCAIFFVFPLQKGSTIVFYILLLGAAVGQNLAWMYKPNYKLTCDYIIKKLLYSRAWTLIMKYLVQHVLMETSWEMFPIRVDIKLLLVATEFTKFTWLAIYWLVAPLFNQLLTSPFYKYNNCIHMQNKSVNCIYIYLIYTCAY